MWLRRGVLCSRGSPVHQRAPFTSSCRSLTSEILLPSRQPSPCFESRCHSPPQSFSRRLSTRQLATSSSPPRRSSSRGASGVGSLDVLGTFISQHKSLVSESSLREEMLKRHQDELFEKEQAYNAQLKAVQEMESIESELEDLEEELKKNESLVNGDDERLEWEAQKRVASRVANYLWHAKKMDKQTLLPIVSSVREDLPKARIWDMVLEAAGRDLSQYLWLTKPLPGVSYEFDESAKEKWLVEPFQVHFDNLHKSLLERVNELKQEKSERQEGHLKFSKAKEKLKNLEEVMNSAREEASLSEFELARVQTLVEKSRNDIETHCELQGVPVPDLSSPSQ